MLSFENVATQEENEIAGTAARDSDRTLPGMPHRMRPLDQLLLLPRDYLANPHQFGRHANPTWVLPTGGDQVSLHVAQLQHEVAYALWQAPTPRLTAQLTQRFGFSKQSYSLVQQGKSWAPLRIMAAQIWALRHLIEQAPSALGARQKQ